jgi:hypothetical protein
VRQPALIAGVLCVEEHQMHVEVGRDLAVERGQEEESVRR